MRQFTPPSFPVYMYGSDGSYKVMTMSEVRPVYWMLSLNDHQC